MKVSWERELVSSCRRQEKMALRRGLHKTPNAPLPKVMPAIGFLLHLVLQWDVRVFKTRVFERWARKAGISDTSLLKAVSDIEGGLIDADLGGNLFKQRVALPGRGKSGSARTLLATRFAGTLYFLFGFEKKDRDNITQ